MKKNKELLDKQINTEISNLPNFPSKDAPIGKDESNNVQVKTWGEPLKQKILNLTGK